MGIAVIEELLQGALDPGAEPDLRRLVSKHVRVLEQTRCSDDGGLVSDAEGHVSGDPDTAFVFDSSGVATLTLDEASWSAGRFETLSIGELRARISRGGGESRLWGVRGR